MRKSSITLLGAAALLAGLLQPGATAQPSSSETHSVLEGRYLVVLAGNETRSGFQAVDAAGARALVRAAGGTVVNDLSRQIGVMFVKGPSSLVDALGSTPLIDVVGSDFGVKSLPDTSESSAAFASTQRGAGGGGPVEHDDALESLQWDMQQIRTREAHSQLQAGWRAVDVGILDSGIDGQHVDFLDAQGNSNVDCARGHSSVRFLPGGPGVGTPNPCIDNQFHGTHVAGTVAAQINEIGIVGVAPGVTLVPVKVCDATGFCYASAVVDGVTYAGDQKLDVINMSFFVDDDEFQESTEFKCLSDPTQRAFRRSVERALQYARSQGVTSVAALGNSDQDLAHPVDDNGQPISNECEVVPAESPGVTGTVALGPQSEKASYSNYGEGEADIAAPGGNGATGDCTTTVLSTVPGNLYLCIQGTSMASPHAAGVAALIVSQFGTLGTDGDVKLSPVKVQNLLQASAVDIGLPGYDECFGNGRIDSLRAVQRNTSTVYDASAPFCPEYDE